MHVPAKVGHEHAAERILRAQPEHEVCEVVEIVRGRACRSRELPVVGVAPVEGVDVLNLRVDLLELVAALERMRVHRPGIVHLRIVDRRILPLRIGRLPAEVRVSRDELRREAASDAVVRGQAGQAEFIERACRTERRRVLPRLGPRVTEPHLEERRRAGHPCAPQDELTIAGIDMAIARAARRQRDVRLIVGRQIAKSVAAKHRQARAHLHVDLSAGLVRIGREFLQRTEVVGVAGNVRIRQR